MPFLVYLAHLNILSISIFFCTLLLKLHKGISLSLILYTTITCMFSFESIITCNIFSNLSLLVVVCNTFQPLPLTLPYIIKSFKLYLNLHNNSTHIAINISSIINTRYISPFMIKPHNQSNTVSIIFPPKSNRYMTTNLAL